MFLTPRQQPLNPFGSNLASLLSDSFFSKTVSANFDFFFLFSSSLNFYTGRADYLFPKTSIYCSLKKNKGACKKSETQFFSGTCQELNVYI